MSKQLFAEMTLSPFSGPVGLDLGDWACVCNCQASLELRVRYEIQMKD